MDAPKVQKMSKRSQMFK
ncbi:hypothetical protein CP061683_0148A, partial [Chlamydia psittaci 06-1683]